MARTRRDRAPILSKFSNYGRSRVIKSVGTALGTIKKGSFNPDKGLTDIGIKPRGNAAGRGARNIGKTKRLTR